MQDRFAIALEEGSGRESRREATGFFKQATVTFRAPISLPECAD
jgi:hypothetical protein